jgi:hypothetical protein
MGEITMPHYFTDAGTYELEESEESLETPFIRGNELHSDDKEHLRQWASNILEKEFAHQMRWLEDVTKAIELTRKRMEKVQGW